MRARERETEKQRERKKERERERKVLKPLYVENEIHLLEWSSGKRMREKCNRKKMSRQKIVAKLANYYLPKSLKGMNSKSYGRT